jgi:hypothetical protein
MFVLGSFQNEVLSPTNEVYSGGIYIFSYVLQSPDDAVLHLMLLIFKLCCPVYLKIPKSEHNFWAKVQSSVLIGQFVYMLPHPTPSFM